MKEILVSLVVLCMLYTVLLINHVDAKISKNKRMSSKIEYKLVKVLRRHKDDITVKIKGRTVKIYMPQIPSGIQDPTTTDKTSELTRVSGEMTDLNLKAFQLILDKFPKMKKIILVDRAMELVPDTVGNWNGEVIYNIEVYKLTMQDFNKDSLFNGEGEVITEILDQRYNF